ncbi:hypothetical protein [Devosia sediminis]|uniref:Uncharacterized protein n=1 Tax=Devosia sediminis TaxID=2798801 RepID=A0A934IWZ4_9HYPH|nr:hypothetical protein [Devosia sediminis]MBJ3786621.1 hypothetical protein [Devosia sediminis]
MLTSQELDNRLKHSCRKLRAWAWMSTVSTQKEDIIDILHDEARELVDLGLQHPDHAKRIGSIIVYYRRLIEQVRDRTANAA